MTSRLTATAINLLLTTSLKNLDWRRDYGREGGEVAKVQVSVVQACAVQAGGEVGRRSKQLVERERPFPHELLGVAIPGKVFRNEETAAIDQPPPPHQRHRGDLLDLKGAN